MTKGMYILWQANYQVRTKFCLVQEDQCLIHSGTCGCWPMSINLPLGLTTSCMKTFWQAISRGLQACVHRECLWYPRCSENIKAWKTAFIFSMAWDPGYYLWQFLLTCLLHHYLDSWSSRVKTFYRSMLSNLATKLATYFCESSKLPYLYAGALRHQSGIPPGPGWAGCSCEHCGTIIGHSTVTYKIRQSVDCAVSPALAVLLCLCV